MKVSYINSKPNGRGTNPLGGQYTEVIFENIEEAKEFGYSKVGIPIQIDWHSVKHIANEPRMGGKNPKYEHFKKVLERKGLEEEQLFDRYQLEVALEGFKDIGEKRFEELRKELTKEFYYDYPYERSMKGTGKLDFYSTRGDAFAVRLKRVREMWAGEYDPYGNTPVKRVTEDLLMVVGKKLITVLLNPTEDFTGSTVMIDPVNWADSEIERPDIWEKGEYVPLSEAFKVVRERL